MIAVAVLTIFAAVAVHEAGHWAAARALGYPARIVVTRFGSVGTSWGTDDRVSSRRDRMIVSLSGPGASCGAGLLMFAVGVPLIPLAAIVALMGLVQLVPFPQTDGRAAWQAFRNHSGIPE